MEDYRRILVLTDNRQIDAILRRTTFARGIPDAAILVAQFIDSHRVGGTDGPAGALPEDLAARQVPALRRRLDLKLSQHNLGWVESRVLCGSPTRLLAELLREWRPGLLITGVGVLPPGAALDVDVLSVPETPPANRALAGLKRLVTHFAS